MTCSSVCAKRARNDASKAGFLRNHCSGAVSSNQKRKTSPAQVLPGMLLSVPDDGGHAQRTAAARVAFRYLLGLAGDTAGFAIAAGAASSIVRTTLEVGRSGPTAAPLTSLFTASSHCASVVTGVLAFMCTTL